MLQYAKSEEFYNEQSLFYRIWYITPTFFIFRMRIYIGMVLSECVCTMAGLGAYPEFTEPSAGHGPTKAFGKLKEMCVSIDVCLVVLICKDV
jgi:lysophospholipid acyltransferase 7